MFQKDTFRKGIRYTIIGMPLAAVIGSSLLPLQPTTRQLLVLAILVWLQITLLFEVFPHS